MTAPSPRKRLFLYPEPVRAPDLPPSPQRKPNPILYGWLLLAAAFLIERVGFIRRKAWEDAGFGCLRAIWDHIALTEPRYDPTVFPFQDDDDDDADVACGRVGHVQTTSPGSRQHHDEPPAAHPVPHEGKNSVALYRSLYLSGELTPLDVAQTILPLIRRDSSPPGEHSVAWFEVHVESVLAMAAASTQRYKEKRSLGPLDGIPTAVKDEFDMEGYKTTLGSPNDYTSLHVPQPKGNDGDSTKTSWCVSRVIDSGAVVLGKLSMHEFGMDTAGYNITYGTPRNPYNPSYYVGGSSSGSAYAVAAGLLPVTLGSDGGGSLRIPAAFTSVFGLKPTHGRLSFFPGQNHSSSAAVNGPMAGDMRSLIALYNAISRPHPRSAFSFPRVVAMPYPYRSSLEEAADDNDGATRPKVLGIPEAWFARASPAVQTLCRTLVDRLAQRKGYRVVPVEMPFTQEGQAAHAITLLTDAATLVRNNTTGLSAANRILVALGRATPASDYQLAQRLRHVLMRHLAWLWQRHPGMVLVTPASACAGWPIRSERELAYGVSDGDQTMRSMEYVWLANLCGVPSISVPAGFAAPGAAETEVADRDAPAKVPVGLMGTGEWCDEEALLRFGLDAEEVGADLQVQPPSWVDIVALAKAKKQDEAAKDC
ncbi:Putative amidase [Colletotrichum destructivum]|uniref:Amidase n=1 Tax=Colletotrichum destructivum TaxID=34406 RepID=A0AAX4IC22_9PEZI|nr:Putative amidase [Colletotrichum destructivum]